MTELLPLKVYPFSSKICKVDLLSVQIMLGPDYLFADWSDYLFADWSDYLFADWSDYLFADWSDYLFADWSEYSAFAYSTKQKFCHEFMHVTFFIKLFILIMNGSENTG